MSASSGPSQQLDTKQGKLIGRNVTGKFYPEVGAGGYTRIDSTVEFFLRVKTVMPAGAVVLDFGAGRGKFKEDSVPIRRELRDLTEKASHSIAVDVDEVVLENKAFSERFVVVVGECLPVRSASVDIVVSDWCWEHVGDPEWAVGEIDRVLKPGGWVCARTPNKWGPVGLPTRLVPNRLHSRVLRRTSPTRRAADTFPTAYRMNTRSGIRRLFGSNYSDYSYCYTPEPGYAGNSVLAWRAFHLLSRVLPSSLGVNIHVFLRKTNSQSEV